MEHKITTGSFEKEVLSCEIPVLVDFYADWCGPCKMMAPVIGQLAEKFEGKVKVGKCNIDEEGELARKFKIMSIPTIIIFVKGSAVDTTIGVVSIEDLEEKLEKYVKIS